VRLPIVAICVICVALGASVTLGPRLWNPSQDNSAVVLVRSMDAALNAHDTASTLGLFAEDASVQDERQPQTHEQIEGWIDELIREQVHLQLVDQPQLVTLETPRAATQVTWLATLDLRMYRSLGFASIPARLRVRVADGTIIFMSIQPDPEWYAVLRLSPVAWLAPEDALHARRA
jgi:hypothetical protein